MKKTNDLAVYFWDDFYGIERIICTNISIGNSRRLSANVKAHILEHSTNFIANTGTCTCYALNMRTSSQLVAHGTILFIIGTVFSVALSVLLTQRHLPFLTSTELTSKAVYDRWWLPLICGSVSALVGLVYPYLEQKSYEDVPTQEWSRVLRCVAVFVGINEACIKIDFPSNLQLFISLAILSIGMWWYFDRTPIGLAMGLSIAVLTTLITQMLVYHEICVYSEKEFSYVRSWLPSVVFSGGITIGNIGKQLALDDISDDKSKKHME